MCNLRVGTLVTWTGDGRQYRITAVHSNPDKSCTYDIASTSNASVTQINVPEGNLRVDV